MTEEEEVRPTEDSEAYRGRYEPVDFGGMTGPERFSASYSGVNLNPIIEELKTEEDELLKRELQSLMAGSSNIIISQDVTKEEFIIDFRNNYRRKREESQREEGYYG